MYKEYEGGSKVTIEQFKGIEINLPREGWVLNRLNGEYVKVGIYKRSSEHGEQYWEAPAKPKDYEIKVKKEKKRQLNEENYKDPELERYRSQ